MFIKSKVARVEQSMTPFWKKERWGYNIYQNKQNLFFEGWNCPYTLKVARQNLESKVQHGMIHGRGLNFWQNSIDGTCKNFQKLGNTLQL